MFFCLWTAIYESLHVADNVIERLLRYLYRCRRVQRRCNRASRVCKKRGSILNRLLQSVEGSELFLVSLGNCEEAFGLLRTSLISSAISASIWKNGRSFDVSRGRALRACTRAMMLAMPLTASIFDSERVVCRFFF